MLGAAALIVCGARCAVAQNVRYLKHQAWSTEDGLPQNSVRQIYQTRDGFLWVATEAGLARFDGLGFRVFDHQNEPAFRNDDICCLAEDAEGVLWIGTDDGVLSYNDHRFQRFDQSNGLPSPAIRKLAASAGGSVAVQTSEGDAVWHADRFVAGGVNTLDIFGEQARQAGWQVSNTSVSRSSRGQSRRWTAGVELPGTRVETLFVDRSGGAWIGTNGGLALIRKDENVATAIEALQGNIVVQVFEDREGNEWAATETSGLHVLRPAKFRIEPALAGLPLTGVVQASDRAVWVGTRRDGLRRLQAGQARDPVPSDALTSNFILSLAPGADGSVWAGTPDGLNHVSAGGKVERLTSADGLPDDYVLSLAPCRDGSVWAGTRHGLVHVAGTKMKVLSMAGGDGGELIGSLLLTPEDDLWIGTSKGLSRRSKDGRIVSYGSADGLPRGVVTGLTEDAGGGLWIVGDGFGLLRFRDGRFEKVVDLGIPAKNYGVLSNAGYLWLRNEAGIARVRVADLEHCLNAGKVCSAAVSSYGVADGIPSVELATRGSTPFWLMVDGELWSPTRRGVAIVDPAHLPMDSVAPPLVIEGLEVDGASIEPGNSPIEIPYGHVRFTVTYAGLSYTAPSEVRYRFRLEGLDREWTEPGNRRTATYTSLAPGSYLFRVQAINHDGVWNQTGASLRFRVVPPYYRRWWFLVLLAVAIAAVAAALYLLRLRRLKRQFDVILRERNRMAREVHDTLAQDFVGVTLQLDIIAQLLGGSKLEAARQQLQETRKLVTDGLADARRSIWALRANVDEMSLPTRLTKLVERYSSEPVSIRLKIGGAFRRLGDEVEAEVLRIAQESLSNVTRHSRAAHAVVELAYESDRLVLTVEDDGNGFTVVDARTMEGHYGLRGMMERAELLRATLEIISKPGAGAKVKLTVSIAPPQR